MDRRDRIIELGREMRRLQVAYYHSRGDKSLLIDAKEAERKFDRALAELDAPQPSLVDEEGNP